MVLASAICDDARGDAGRRGRSHIGQRDGEQRAIGDAADQVADENPAPVDHHRAGAGLALQPRQRHQRKAAGDELEPEQHDADQADREDQRADQRHVGLHRAGEGKAGRDAENGARQHAANEKVARCQRKLAPAGLDHRHRDIGWFHIVHRSSPSMVIIDGAPSRAALLIAAARRKTPLRCKQQDGCHLAVSGT